MITIGIDPGNTTGWAAVDSKTGDIKELKHIPFETVSEFLSAYDWSQVDRVICEDFRLFPNKAKEQAGSDFQVVQVIGMVKQMVMMKNIPLIMQMSSILPIAERQAGLKIPKKHSESHKIVALLHTRFWMIHNRIIPSVAQQSVSAQRAIPASDAI